MDYPHIKLSINWDRDTKLADELKRMACRNANEEITSNCTCCIRKFKCWTENPSLPPDSPPHYVRR